MSCVFLKGRFCCFPKHCKNYVIGRNTTANKSSQKLESKSVNWICPTGGGSLCMGLGVIPKLANRTIVCLAVFFESFIGRRLKKLPKHHKTPHKTTTKTPPTKKVQHPCIHLCPKAFSIGVLPIPLRFTHAFSEFGNDITSLILARSPRHLILCYLHLPTWLKSLCNTFHRHLL